MLLEQKPPSTNWESIPVDQSGKLAVWAWFRPAQAPSSVILVVPAALFADAPSTKPPAAKLSVRQLVAATGLDVPQILSWSVNGMNFDAAGGTSPLLDQPLPAPAQGGQVHLTVWMNVPQLIPQSMPWGMAAPVIAAAPMPQINADALPMAVSPSQRDEQLLAAIDSSWNSIRQLEAKVGMIRKQLDQAVSRLNSLNRDLTPEERRASDNKDTKDWQDARRWLRDSLGSLSRFIKEIDLGTTSGAGQRHRMEAMYQQYVVQRIPFAGLEQAVLEFDSHAKILQNLVASAQTGLTRAGHDAEQRANGVLMRIGAKSRSSRR